MKSVTKYKGVVLRENMPNTVLNYKPYAVYLTNGGRFEFSTVAEFKRAVNSQNKLGIMQIDSDGKWRGKGVKPGEFFDYAIKYQIK